MDDDQFNRWLIAVESQLNDILHFGSTAQKDRVLERVLELFRDHGGKNYHVGDRVIYVYPFSDAGGEWA